MTNDEILQAAKDAGMTLIVGHPLHPYSVYRAELERFATIIEKRTIERCAEFQYTRSCNRHGYDKHDDAAAIRELGEQ